MAGRKTVRLTVSYTADSQTIEVFDEVIITVESQLVSVPPGPPVAEAGSNQLAAVNKEVSFDGSDSTSPYGGSLRYLWVFGDERDPTAGSNKMMPSYAYTTPGTKRVTLIVIDEETGLTDSDEVTITVIGVTVTGAPRVVAVGDPDPVEFRSTVSNAPEGADLSYSWDFGDGAIYLRRYGSTASCQYTLPGDQTVTLTVGVTIDGKSVEVEGTCVIKVFKVDAGAGQIVAVDDRVQFAGSVSNAPEDADLTYSWAFDEGATNAEDDDGLTPSCSYTTSGEKTVTLTVSFTIDGESVEGSSTVKITVLEWPLRVQGPRTLSALERDAFELVFGTSLTPPRIQIFEHLDNTADPGGAAGSYDAANDIVKIARDAFPYTEDLNGDSTRANTDIFKPGNMKFLNTFIHECTHHWQSVKNRHTDAGPAPSKYEFTRQELEDLDLLKEQHASAAAAWFVIGWQIEYRDVEVEPMINLTEKPPENNVGKVFRYTEINEIPHVTSNSRYSGRWVTRLRAEELSSRFADLLIQLQGH